MTLVETESHLNNPYREKVEESNNLIMAKRNNNNNTKSISSSTKPISRPQSPSSLLVPTKPTPVTPPRSRNSSSTSSISSLKSNNNLKLLTQSELTTSLDQVLRKEKAYETEEGMRKRDEVLTKLTSLIKQWIQSVSLSRGMNWNNLAKVGGRIVTYGSHKLGISHQGADIDALCLAPQHIARQEYFTSLVRMLDYQNEITELRAIQEAYVPVIKMRFSGIEIDMTFARLNMPDIPDELDFLESDLNLTSLDKKCVLSLNGFRATIELLKIVPDKKAFQITLRAIKLWAKSQGLYSNSLGYLGGFSWAVLVAKICMMYPADSEPSFLIQQFFDTFSKWDFPNPVVLTQYENKPHILHLEQQGGNNSGSSINNNNNACLTGLPSPVVFSNVSFLPDSKQMFSWNPEKNSLDKHQVMPIITPTYPHLNSTFNVTKTSLKLIQNKMKAASSLVEKIFEGKENWESLFMTQHILEDYNHFIVIRLLAKQFYMQWFGLIESKLRHFINNLERDCSRTIQSARIWPIPLSKKREESLEEKSEQIWIIGLEYHPESEREDLDCQRTVNQFKESLRSQSKEFYDTDMVFHADYVSDLKSNLSNEEMQQIFSMSSPKRESSPPPPQYKQHPKAPLTLDFDFTSPSPVTSSGHYFNSGEMSPSAFSTTSSNSKVSSSNNNNGHPPFLNVPPPPPPRLINVPPPQQVRGGQQQMYGSPNSANYFHPQYQQQHPHHQPPLHHQSIQHYHNYNSPYQSFHVPPPSSGLGLLGHHGPPIMERTWNTTNSNMKGNNNNNNNHQKNNKGNNNNNNNILQSHLAVDSPRKSTSSPQIATSSTGCSTMGTTSSVSAATGGGDFGGERHYENWPFSSMNPHQEFDVGLNLVGIMGATPSTTAMASGGGGSCNSSNGGGGDSGQEGSLDSELGRSVSFSSDKFPTPALVSARLHHLDNKVASPSGNNSVFYSTPYDPNGLVSTPSSPMSSPSMGNNSMGRSSSYSRFNSNQRYSSSELPDVNTPQPVSRMSYAPFHFSFNPGAIQQLSGNDSVFH